MSTSTNNNEPVTEATDRLNAGRGIPSKNAIQETLLETVSAQYRPGLPIHGWTYDFYPSFQFWFDIEDMLEHSSVFTPLWFVQAPTMVAEHEIVASDKRVEAFARSQLDHFWGSCIRGIIDSSDPYGWMGGEVVYKHVQGYLSLDKIKAFAPRDVSPLMRKGEMVGIQVRNSGAGELRLWLGADKVPSKGFWHTHRPRFGHSYGRSALRPAWRDWKRLAGRDGLEETSDLGAYRYSLGITMIRYPNEKVRNEDGSESVARDVAREMGESLRSGATIQLPSTPYNTSTGADGKYKWELDYKSPELRLSELGEREGMLRKRISGSIGFPAELMEAAETGSGFSGRMIPMMAYLLSRQSHVNELTLSFDERILRPLVFWNFGAKAWVKVQARPLLQTFHHLFSNQKETAGGWPSAAPVSPASSSPPPAGPVAGAPPAEHIMAAITEAQREALSMGNPHANDKEIAALKMLASGEAHPTGKDGFVGGVSHANHIMAKGVGSHANEKLYRGEAANALTEQAKVKNKVALGWVAETSKRTGRVHAVGTGEHAGRVLYGDDAQNALNPQTEAMHDEQNDNSAGDDPTFNGDKPNAYNVLSKIQQGEALGSDDVVAFADHAKMMSIQELQAVNDVLVAKLGGISEHRKIVRELRDKARDLITSDVQSGRIQEAGRKPLSPTPPPLPSIDPAKSEVAELPAKDASSPSQASPPVASQPPQEAVSHAADAEKAYQDLRAGSYHDKGHPHDDRILDASSAPAEGIRPVQHPDWHFRFGNGFDTKKPVVARASINAHADRELIRKLDAFARKHKVGFKTPSTDEGWLGRHDPVSVYSDKEFTPEQKSELAKIVAPFSRGNEGLIGEKIGDGVSVMKEPTRDDTSATLGRIAKHNPQAAKELQDWVGEDGASAGMQHVLDQVAAKHESAAKPAQTPTALPAPQSGYDSFISAIGGEKEDTTKRDIRKNTLLEEAFGGPSNSATAKAPAAKDSRANPLLEEAIGMPSNVATSAIKPAAPPATTAKPESKPAEVVKPVVAKKKGASAMDPVPGFVPPANVHPDLAKMDAYRGTKSPYMAGVLQTLHDEHAGKSVGQLEKALGKHESLARNAVGREEKEYETSRANLVAEMLGKARRKVGIAQRDKDRQREENKQKAMQQREAARAAKAKPQEPPQAEVVEQPRPSVPKRIHPELAKLDAFKQSLEPHQDHLRDVHANNIGRSPEALLRSASRHDRELERAYESGNPDAVERAKSVSNLLWEMHGTARRKQMQERFAKEDATKAKKKEQEAAASQARDAREQERQQARAAKEQADAEAEKAKVVERRESRLNKIRTTEPKRDPKSKLRYIVRQMGGVNADVVGKDFNVDEDLRQGGLQSLIRRDVNNPHKGSLENLAQTLQTEGYLRVPEGRHPDEYLLEQLQKDADHEHANNEGSFEDNIEYELYQSQLKSYEEAQERHQQEMEAARESGEHESDIAEAVRLGESDGQTEAHASFTPEEQEGIDPAADDDPTAEYGDEFGDAGDDGEYERGEYDDAGYGGPDQDASGLDDFNFGYNAAGDDEQPDDGDTPAFAADVPGSKYEGLNDEQPQESSTPDEAETPAAPETRQAEATPVEGDPAFQPEASIKAVDPVRVPVNDPSLDKPFQLESSKASDKPTESPSEVPPAPPPKKAVPIVGTSKGKGGESVNWTHHSTYGNKSSHETVMIDPHKLEADYRNAEPDMAVGPNGENATEGKLEGVGEWSKSGRPMEAVRLGFSVDNQPTMIDGRHRLRHAVNSGMDQIAATVSKRDAAAVKRRYGVEPKADDAGAVADKIKDELEEQGKTNKPEYVRAPAGGQVSEVDGVFYKGGRLMPIHGKYAGMERTKATGNNVNPEAIPSDGQEKEGEPTETKERRIPQQLTPEELEQEKENQRYQSMWEEMSAGPLGRVKPWMGDRPNGRALDMGVHINKWHDFAREVGPEGIQHIIKTLEPQIHQAIEQNSGGEDAEWFKNDLRERATRDQGNTRSGNKIERDLPGTHYARVLLESAMSEHNHKGTKPIDQQYGLNGLLTEAKRRSKIDHNAHAAAIRNDPNAMPWEKSGADRIVDLAGMVRSGRVDGGTLASHLSEYAQPRHVQNNERVGKHIETLGRQAMGMLDDNGRQEVKKFYQSAMEQAGRHGTIPAPVKEMLAKHFGDEYLSLDDGTNFKDTTIGKALGGGDQVSDPTQAAPVQNDTTPKDATPADPHLALTDELAGMLGQGKTPTANELFDAANKAHGGTRAEGKYGQSDAYDSLEAALNKHLMGKTDPTVGLEEAQQQANELKNQLDQFPTQTNRSGTKDSFQQFSTPPHYAYAANWVANHREGDQALEPSAGTGSLAVHAHNAGVNLHTNELDKRRGGFLKHLFGPEQVHSENAEQIGGILPNRGVKDLDTVVMNPPFSQTAGRMGDKKDMQVAPKHIDEGLNLLKQNGRLVAIVGRGMTPDSPTYRAWFDKIKKNHSIRANVAISGDEYKKYGTHFGTRMLVIDKTGPHQGETVTGDAADVPDLMQKLEGVRNDRPRPIEQTPGKPTSGQVPQGNEGASGRIDAPSGAVSDPVAGVGGTEQHAGAPAVPTGDARPSDAPAGREPAMGSQPAGAGLRNTGAGDGSGPQQSPATGSSAKSPRRGAGGAKRGQNATGSGGGAGGESVPQPAPSTPKLRPPERLAVTKPVDAAGASTPEKASGNTGGREVAEQGVIPSSPGQNVPKNNEDLGSSLYESYTPSQLHIPGMQPHRASLVESAAMASIRPPKPKYQPHLSPDVVEKGILSSAQLEAVVYAGQAHSKMIGANEKGEGGKRRAFFFGDGTGVGKGRQIAGVIADNMNQGRKRHVWITEKQSLLNDAGRDWQALGMDQKQLFHFDDLRSGKAPPDGVCFVTYGLLRQPPGEGKKSNHEILTEWLGKDHDGVIVFDEAHAMGNAIDIDEGMRKKTASKTAAAGLDLQNHSANSRVCYVSATGATEITNLAYADRLGLWGQGTAFQDKKTFFEKMKQGGVAALECVSQNLKAMGSYMSRSISLNDGTPEGTVEFGRVTHKLQPHQEEMYNALADGWQKVLQNMDQAMEVTGGANVKGHRAEAQFWSAHQRFFNQLLTSMQTQSVIERMEDDLKNGRAPVVQLVSTGASNLDKAKAKRKEGEEDDDLDVSPAAVLQQFIDKSFPTERHEEYVDENGNTRMRPVKDSEGNPVHDPTALKLKQDMMAHVESLKRFIPETPIDQILNHFGHDQVAEITSRKERLLRGEDGRRQLVSREDGWMNSEAADFQGGKRKILIFSNAGGTGSSYHADKNAANQAQRSHYVLQPGWQADKAVQGLGRTHRTNQTSAPKFHLVEIDRIPSQKRFVSTIARRLDQLGALTKGQRQAGSGGLFSASDNLESKQAADALDRFKENLANGSIEGLDHKEVMKQLGFLSHNEDATRNKDADKKMDDMNINKFLNRMLSMRVDMQGKVFEAFDRHLREEVERAKQNESIDTGVENFFAVSMKKVASNLAHRDPESEAEANHLIMRAKKKNPKLKYAESIQDEDFVHHVRHKGTGKILAVYKGVPRTDTKTGQVHEQVKLVGPDKKPKYMDSGRVNVSASLPSHPASDFEYLSPEAAQKEWFEQYQDIPEHYETDEHFVAGAFLPIWNLLPDNERPRIYRLRTDDGETMVARHIPKKSVEQTLRNLNLTADKRQYSHDELHEKIGKGRARANLAGGWRLEPRRVQGERRIELIGPHYGHERSLTSDGVIKERISYNDRYFIPTGEAGKEVMRRLLTHHQVVDVDDDDS